MNKVIVAHIVEGVLNVLIERRNQPGAGGAFSSYALRDPENNLITFLNFQEGTIAEAGVNGVTNESLLAIVKDRLECFQSGSCSCVENEQAIRAIEEALRVLKERTLRRLAQGTEGKHIEAPVSGLDPAVGEDKTVPSEPEAKPEETQKTE